MGKSGNILNYNILKYGNIALMSDTYNVKQQKFILPHICNYQL